MVNSVARHDSYFIMAGGSKTIDCQSKVAPVEIATHKIEKEK